MRFLLSVSTLVLTSTLLADDWPQWMGPKRDSIWREEGIVEKLPEDGPKVLWRKPVGVGYSGPSVVGKYLYVMDYVTSDNTKQENFTRKNSLKGKERTICLNIESGEMVWKQEYDREYRISYPNGPRCTPTVHEGKVYSLGAEGDLNCLDAEKGIIIWSKDFNKDYKTKTPLWGYASHPLIDDKKLICVVGGEGSAVVAFDKDTGKEIWKALTCSEQGYCPPTIIESAGTRQLLIWNADSINALNPESGEVYWTIPVKAYRGMAIMAPQKDGDMLIIGAVFGTCLGIKLGPSKNDAKVVWKGKQKQNGIYPCNMTPFVEEGLLYGFDQPGQLMAMKIETGEKVWESWLPVHGKEEPGRNLYCGTGFLVKNKDRFYMFNERGELIIAKLSAKGYEEISRAKLLEPTGTYTGRDVVWSHPAFAKKCMFARNDKELISVSLAK